MESPFRLCLCPCLCIFLTVASLCAADDYPSKTVKLENKCLFTVWPAIASINEAQYPAPTDFRAMLNPGESDSITFAAEWDGRVWGRFGCSFDQSGRGSCHSGDCGGYLRCVHFPLRGQISTPITQAFVSAEYTSINLEKGYNLPMSIKSCGSQGCTANVVDVCPTNLQVKSKNEVVGCQGSCDSYLQRCTPEEFNSAFKIICPNVKPFQGSLECLPTTNSTITFCPVQ